MKKHQQFVETTRWGVSPEDFFNNLGYLHTERYGRPSLALDLMEEFRPLIVDSLVLGAINRKIFKPSDFQTEPISNAVSLTKEKLHEFLRLYQEKKLTKFTHPVLKIKKAIKKHLKFKLVC